MRVLTVDVEGNLIYTPFPDYEREVRSADTIRRWTFSLDGAAVATRVIGDPDTANNGLVYIHGDHLGSMTVISDDEGELKDSARYYPYGGRRVSPTHEITDSGYTGHKHNDDLGLIYMVARYYDPALRRFISADTIVPVMTDTRAYNRFAYVNNNPVNFNDPTGHIACDSPYLSGDDAQGCQGESVPVPTNPSQGACQEAFDPACGPLPPIATQKGDNTTVLPGRELSDEDLLLLTLAVFVETQNASHLDLAMILKAWTYLMKIAMSPNSSVFDAINYGTTNTWLTYELFVDTWKKNIGPFPEGDDDEAKKGQAEWLLKIANSYMGGSDIFSKNFQHLYELIAGEGGVYAQWLAYGSNSWADPSYGAIYAVDRPASSLGTLLPILSAYSQSNRNFGYVIAWNRYGLSVTLVGNAECIYRQSLCN